MQASPASPPVSSSLYHARLAPKRTDKHGEARASRDHLSVGDVALELAVMSRAGAARASIDVHAKVPSAGAGATRCAMLGPDQLSTTTKRVVALKTCAASRLFRCSGVVMAASAWVLARRGRCGPCIALMTKKVEEGRLRDDSQAPRALAAAALALKLGVRLTGAAHDCGDLVPISGGRGRSPVGPGPPGRGPLGGRAGAVRGVRQGVRQRPNRQLGRLAQAGVLRPGARYIPGIA